MAVCEWCNREMRGTSCEPNPRRIRGVPFTQIRYGQEERYGEPKIALPRCRDCGAPPGGLHHPGCDWEECPRCHGQLISCECPFDGREPEDDDESLN